MVAVAVGLFFAAAVVMNFDRTGVGSDFGRATILGVISLVRLGYAAVDRSRPTPRTAQPATPAPAGDWYFARNGGKVGPFTLDQMQQMAASGALSADDMVLDPWGGR
ncbi:MAG: domain 2 [Gemmataceae bacterium]|nr:domain 2 [Gemmataceae bacterium]